MASLLRSTSHPEDLVMPSRMQHNTEACATIKQWASANLDGCDKMAFFLKCYDDTLFTQPEIEKFFDFVRAGSAGQPTIQIYQNFVNGWTTRGGMAAMKEERDIDFVVELWLFARTFVACNLDALQTLHCIRDAVQNATKFPAYMRTIWEQFVAAPDGPDGMWQLYLCTHMTKNTAQLVGPIKLRSSKHSREIVVLHQNVDALHETVAALKKELVDAKAAMEVVTKQLAELKVASSLTGGCWQS